jgi:hypothetical protein
MTTINNPFVHQVQETLKYYPFVILQHNDGEYAVFTGGKTDENGDFLIQIKNWNNSIANCKNGEYCVELLNTKQDYYDFTKWKLIEGYNPCEMIPVGTKVRIRKESKEKYVVTLKHFNVIVDQSLANIYTIESYRLSQYMLFSENCNVATSVPLSALELVFDEPEQDIILTLEDIAELKGVDVSRIKIVK